MYYGLSWVFIPLSQFPHHPSLKLIGNFLSTPSLPPKSLPPTPPLPQGQPSLPLPPQSLPAIITPLPTLPPPPPFPTPPPQSLPPPPPPTPPLPNPPHPTPPHPTPPHPSTIIISPNPRPITEVSPRDRLMQSRKWATSLYDLYTGPAEERAPKATTLW